MEIPSGSFLAEFCGIGRDRPSSPAGDGGEGTASYLAVVLLVSLLVSTLIVSSVPAQIAGSTEKAACEVGGTDCGPGRTEASPDAGRRSASDAPVKGGSGTRASGGGGADQPTDTYWDCGWFGQPACDMTLGFGRGTKDLVSETVDGVGLAACLLHLCSHQGFKDDWGGVKKLFTTDPRDTAKALWDDSTKDILEDAKNGHEGTAVTRTVPTLLGTVFAGGWLRKMAKGGKALPVLDHVSVAEHLRGLGLPDDEVERLLHSAEEHGVLGYADDISRRAAKGRIPKDLAQNALHDLDEVVQSGKLDPDSYRQLIRNLAHARAPQAFSGAYAEVQAVKRVIDSGDLPPGETVATGMKGTRTVRRLLLLARAWVSNRTLARSLAGRAPEPNATVRDLLSLKPGNPPRGFKIASSSARSEEELLHSVFHPGDNQFMATQPGAEGMLLQGNNRRYELIYRARDPKSKLITWDTPIFINYGTG